MSSSVRLPDVNSDTMVSASAEGQGGKPRLMLTRPMVGCDEDLGFLPGNVEEKTLPWLLPFKDVLADLTFDSWERMQEAVDVEFIPTGMLRGRTVSHGILIADELQNATASQIKCILTRIGRGGRIIALADPDQSAVFVRVRGGLLFWRGPHVLAVGATYDYSDRPGL